MTEIENLLLDNKWEEVCNLVKSVKLPKIAIPTYLNRENNSIRQLAKELGSDTEILLFVYDFDLDNYQEYTNLDNVKIITVPLNEIEYRGITPKRKFILNYFNERKEDKIFLLGDDISPMIYRAEFKKEGEKLKPRIKCNLIDCLKVMAYLSEMPNYKDFGIFSFYRLAWIKFCSKPVKLDVRPAGGVLLNLQQLRNYSINYDTNFKTGEDCDIALTCYANGLKCFCISNLASDFTIKAGSKQSLAGTLQDWKNDWYKLFVKHKGFLDLINYDDLDTLKYKEHHRKIYSNDNSFKDEEHKKRWEYAKNRSRENSQNHP